jgi:hypothetical protein
LVDVDVDVRPGVIMRVLHHPDQGVTMKMYAKASSDKRLLTHCVAGENV